MEKNKCVTEMTEETQEDHIDHIGDRKGKLVAKARPKQTSIPTTSSPTVTLPCDQREWIDVEPGPMRQEFEVSKKDDQVASTRSFCTPRRRSSRIQNLGTDVSFRIYVFSAVVNSNMAEPIAKMRRSQEEISVLCGSMLC